MGPLVGNRRAYFLVAPSFTREVRHYVDADCRHVRDLRARFPEHRHIFLCNTRAELENYRAENTPAILCNKNCFVDETVFRIPENPTREFDAVYNAVLAPYKRHALCRDIGRLALIYHRFVDLNEKTPDYPDQVRAMLPQATFVNELEGDYRSLSPPSIAAWLGRSAVGLCLSDVEGQMRACAEYLLCGLPVVTTPNLGGRDRLLDPAFSVTVEPTPEAVAAGVRELAARQIDPRYVRHTVSTRLKPDRMRLVRLIAAIHKEEGIPLAPHIDWLKLFRCGPWDAKSPDALMNETTVTERRRSESAAG